VRRWFKYIVYLSVIFLVIALAKADYLNIPKIHSVSDIGLSFVFLFLGFVLQCVIFQQVLTKGDCPIGLQDGIASFGLSVFSKYIPGKVLMVVSPAMHVSEKHDYTIKNLISLSLNIQFIVLWVGIILGAFGLFLLNGLDVWGGTLLISWMILTLIIFFDAPHNMAATILSKIFKKKIQIPKLSFFNVLKVLPWFVIYWLSFCIAFYFLTSGLSEIEVSFSAGFGFALAATLGIVAIIAPGGIGVREGFLAGYLTLAGLSIHEAATISVASRLWFLVGEVFIFLLGFAANKIK